MIVVTDFLLIMRTPRKIDFPFLSNCMEYDRGDNFVYFFIHQIDEGLLTVFLLIFEGKCPLYLYHSNWCWGKMTTLPLHWCLLIFKYFSIQMPLLSHWMYRYIPYSLICHLFTRNLEAYLHWCLYINMNNITTRIAMFAYRNRAERRKIECKIERKIEVDVVM